MSTGVPITGPPAVSKRASDSGVLRQTFGPGILETYIADGKGLAVIAFHAELADRVSADPVHQPQIVPIAVPAFAPLPQRGNHREQVAALVGEPVLVAGAVLAGIHLAHHAAVHQSIEAIAEDVLGDAQP